MEDPKCSSETGLMEIEESVNRGALMSLHDAILVNLTTRFANALLDCYQRSRRSLEVEEMVNRQSLESLWQATAHGKWQRSQQVYLLEISCSPPHGLCMFAFVSSAHKSKYKCQYCPPSFPIHHPTSA